VAKESRRRTAFEREVKTFAQSLVAVLTTAGTGLLDTDWMVASST